MNRMEMERKLSRAIALLEMMADQISNAMEACDSPISGHLSIGIYELKGAVTKDLMEVITALPSFDKKGQKP